MMRTKERIPALVLVLSASVAFASPQTAKDEPWNEVRKLTHRKVFQFIQRDQNCVTGEIKKVTDKSVVVTPRSAASVTIQKDNIVRITLGDWPAGVITTVYSGQSSWNDVAQLGKLVAQQPKLKQRMSVATNAGQNYDGDLREVTDGEIVLYTNEKEVSILKANVASVDFQQFKPLTSAGEYSWSELGPFVVFDPELYPRLFHLGDTIPVRLYDGSRPEDNASVTCNP